MDDSEGIIPSGGVPILRQGNRGFCWIRQADVLDGVSGIYVIQAGAAGPIKIGRSRAVGARLAALQSMHWEGLIVRLVIEAAGGSESSAIERHLHAAFGFLKIRGEWYRYAGPLESFVNRRWLVEARRAHAYRERESA